VVSFTSLVSPDASGSYGITVTVEITVTVHLIDWGAAISMRSIWTSVYCWLVKCTVTVIPNTTTTGNDAPTAPTPPPSCR
jgi:hypothetical protein